MGNISPKYRRDYSQRDYSNQLLRRDRIKRKSKLAKIVVAVFIAGAVVSVYFLFSSPVFIIKKIEIQGLQKIKPEKIYKIVNEYRAKRWLWLFSRNNWWLLSGAALQDKIFEHYFFENFQIKKMFPNKVLISLKEKETTINWLTNNQCYHLDLTGQVIEYCENEFSSITVKDKKNRELKMGERPLSADEARYIMNLYEQLRRIFSVKLKFTQFAIENQLIDAATQEGIVIKMNMKLAVDEQMSRLDTLISQPDIKNNLLKMEYIDLRFGEKVYYK